MRFVYAGSSAKSGPSSFACRAPRSRRRRRQLAGRDVAARSRERRCAGDQRRRERGTARTRSQPFSSVTGSGPTSAPAARASVSTRVRFYPSASTTRHPAAAEKTMRCRPRTSWAPVVGASSPVTICTSCPSAFATATWPSRTNAIRRPSGDQAAFQSSCSPSRSGFAPLPSAFASRGRRGRRPSLVKTIRSPSGDHDGSISSRTGVGDPSRGAVGGGGDDGETLAGAAREDEPLAIGRPGGLDLDRGPR